MTLFELNEILDNDNKKLSKAELEGSKIDEKNYLQAVKKLNCKFSNEHGICNEFKEYCPLLACKHYEEKEDKQ